MENKLETNKTIAREYVQRVFNEHNPILAEKYRIPLHVNRERLQ